MKKLLSLLFLSLFFMLSCDKDEKTEPTFNIKYQFIISDNQYELSKVSVYAHTYFPKENETFIHGFSKYKNVDFDDEYYLNIVDTLESSPSLKAYIGCETYLEVKIYYKEELEKQMEIIVLQDTLTTNNGLIRFEWPGDTISMN